MANLTNYEFQDLVDKIQNKLKNKQGWGDSYESSVGQTLIDINAEAADILSYMLERRSQENHIISARLRSSIITNASESGYRPRRRVASNGTLNFRLTDDSGVDKPVESGGQVFIDENETITFNGENFVTRDVIDLSGGELQQTIPIVQGTFESINIDVQQEQTFQNGGYILFTDYEDIAEDTIEVYADGIEYKDVRNIEEIRNMGTLSMSDQVLNNDDETGSYFDIRYSPDGMRIQFGDGVFGRLPTNNIQINFVRTKGRGIRVLSLNNNFQFNFETVNDSINVTPLNEYYYDLTNQTTIVNGREAESIDQIRLNAPLSNTLNERAVSLQGYNFWAKRSGVGGIIDANTFGEKELETLLFNLNNVYISYLTESGNALDTTQKQQFIDFMKQRDVSLAHIIPIKADEIKIGIEVDYKRNGVAPISNSEVYQIIKNFLVDYFSRKEGSIGNVIHKSDIIRDFYTLTEKIEGINYKLTDFVDISMNAYQQINFPIQTSFSSLYIDPTIEGNVSAGDVFSIEIDGNLISVVIESGDLGSTITESLSLKMRDEIFLQTNLTAEVIDVNGSGAIILNISTSDNFGSFSINSSVGDIQTYVDIVKRYQIIPKTFSTGSLFENIIFPNSIFIFDSSNNVVYRDDGSGNWLDYEGNAVAMGTFFDVNGVQETPIDYSNAVVYFPPNILIGSPPSEDGDFSLIPDSLFIIKYKQDEFDNFTANDAAAVTLIEPKDTFEDSVETYSQIRFV